MRTVVFGSSGLLGSALCRSSAPGMEIIGIDRANCDITKKEQVSQAVAKYRPDVVINAAAVPDTRGCEADPSRALRVNAFGARNCAIAAEMNGSAYVQISGNVVFAGIEEARERREWEPVDNHVGTLAASKIAAEGYALTLSSRPLIIRTASLFGDRKDGTPGGLVGRIRELVGQGQKLQMVNNSWTNASFADDVADAVLALLGDGQLGIFHVVNKGVTSPAALASSVVEYSSLDSGLLEETIGEREDSRLLATDLSEAAGISMRPLNEALAAYLTR
ncbi:SDR family oxidoreductase [Streptomyces sp. DSM 41987]|uniref:SDR family oxidoreductase n=1 Tax=Streptomyces TaxID=1883 RepID=UPI00361E3C0F